MVAPLRDPEDVGIDGLPRGEYAFPGPLRDALVTAILSGAKTATSSLVCEYGDDPLPAVGRREALIDSHDRPVAVLETTAVAVVPLAHVDLAHARDEGEGYTTVEEWRAGRTGADYVAHYGAAAALSDTTPVVLERFRVIARLSPHRENAPASPD